MRFVNQVEAGTLVYGVGVERTDRLVVARSEKGVLDEIVVLAGGNRNNVPDV